MASTVSLAKMLESSLSQIKNLTASTFKIEINPETHLVQIANRLESLPIYSIQTILNATDDIFATYRIGPVPVPDSFDNAFLIMVRKDFSDSYPLLPVIFDRLV